MADQVTDQVTGNAGDQGGDQGGDANNQQTQSLGWRSALSDEFKDHDFVKEFEKPTDFVKAALDIKTERDGLNDKLKNAIVKPGKDATDEEIAAYRKAMGVPESPEGYEFPKGEGVEHDEQMVKWAQDVFHKAGLSTDQAATIAQAWDGFVQGMSQAAEEQTEKAKQEAEAKLKEEWGKDYDKNLEYTKRGWKKFSDEDFDAFADQTGIGNHPALIRFIYNVGKAMGEDFSPPPSPDKGKTEPTLGMNYEGMDQFGG